MSWGKSTILWGLLGIVGLTGCEPRLLDVDLSEERIESLTDECSLINTVIYNQDAGRKKEKLFRPTKACQDAMVELIPEFDRESFLTSPLSQRVFDHLMRGMHVLFFYPIHLTPDGSLFHSDDNQIPERYYEFLPYSVAGAPSVELSVNHINLQALLFFLRRVKKVVYGGIRSDAAMAYRSSEWRIRVYDNLAIKDFSPDDTASLLVHEASHWDDRSGGNGKGDHDPCTRGFDHDCDDRLSGPYGANVIVRSAIARAAYFVHLPTWLGVDGWMDEALARDIAWASCAILKTRINEMPAGTRWEDFHDCGAIAETWIQRTRKLAGCGSKRVCI